MPTPTYVPLIELTLTSTTSDIDFINIDQSFRDLALVVSLPPTAAGSLYAGVRVNGDSGTYVSVYMNGDGTTANGGISASSYFFLTPAITIANDAFTGTMEILDYSTTDKITNAISRHGSTNSSSSAKVGATVGRWSSTAAITSLTISTSIMGGTTPYPIGSTFCLYGIAS